MSKVFLYSRVSTSTQTLEQQERTVYEWLKAHNMSVDEVISDEGVSGGVGYADRKLGKELLPKTSEGDVIIVSEVSRLGRSMYDLSKLIHTELKPRKLRLVICGMGIDLNCAKITPIDQLILSNFSFAAELEKTLIKERTLSALAVRKQKGVKLGASNPKYRENYKNKSEEQKKKEQMKKGRTKNDRFTSSRDVVAFTRIVKRVFPDACDGDEPMMWKWNSVTTRGDNCKRIIELMKDYRSVDDSNVLFDRWHFSEWNPRQYQKKLCMVILHLKRAFESKKQYQNI